MEAPPYQAAAVEEAICARVAERATEWFPDVGTAASVRLHRLAERPRALVYAVAVGDDPSPRVLAKVRRDWPAGPGALPAGGRPRLTTDFLPAAEQTDLEYHGLTAIAAMIGGSDPDFAAVRPLDHLVAEKTILMDFVRARTLRTVMVRGSRISPQRWLPGGRPPSDVWRRSGAWLRIFQQHMRADGLSARQQHRDEVVALFSAFGEFLERRLGREAVGDVPRLGAKLAADVLPPELPLTVGHGDYAPRNVFLQDDGRLAVFDPLPRWLVPRFEDLCRFLVGLRLQGLPLHTRGLADGTRELDRREREMIEGFSDGEQLPMAQLRCYQLLITLDKWSTHVEAMGASRSDPVQRIRDRSVKHASGYVRAEGRRLLALAEGAG
jgi:hypothetical protein